MKRLRKQHVLEQSIYGAIWIVIFLLPLIGGYFAMSGGLEREETRMVWFPISFLRKGTGNILFR